MRTRPPVARAYSTKQKEERRQTILDMTWRLFQASSYDDVIMIDIAEALGLVKGTIYRCFRSKEELFLAVLEQQLNSWFVELDSWLGGIRGSCSILHITALLSQSLEARPALLRLLIVLRVTLERKIEREVMLRFRLCFMQRIMRTGALLEQRLPFLRPGQGARLLIHYHAFAVGLWQFCDTSLVAQSEEQASEMKPFERKFSNEISYLLYTLLIGVDRQTQEGESVTQD
jgi:AcrR family transcriptional regulator